MNPAQLEARQTVHAAFQPLGKINLHDKHDQQAGRPEPFGEAEHRLGRGFHEAEHHHTGKHQRGDPQRDAARQLEQAALFQQGPLAGRQPARRRPEEGAKRGELIPENLKRQMKSARDRLSVL